MQTQTHNDSVRILMYSKSMARIYYEDIELHQKFRSRKYLLTEEEIIEFAQKWDPMPFHTDPECAKKTRFGGLFASGFHLLDICHRLAWEMFPDIAAIAGLGLDEVRWNLPGRPGDYMTCEGSITAKRSTKSQPDVGFVRFYWSLVNDKEQLVMSYNANILIHKQASQA